MAYLGSYFHSEVRAQPTAPPTPMIDRAGARALMSEQAVGSKFAGRTRRKPQAKRKKTKAT